MKGKIIWLVMSWLMVLSLVLAACAPKVTEKEEVAKKEEAPTQEAVTKEEAVAPVTKKAKYGGILTMKDLMAQAAEADPPRYGGTITLGLSLGGFNTIGQYWDEALRPTFWWGMPMTLTHDDLLVGDWTRGAEGTGEFYYHFNQFAPEGAEPHTGRMAESWEIPDNQTLIFKIRRGVRWHDKPPVNGREFTAADVVFNIKRTYIENPKSYLVNTSPGAYKVTDVYLKPDDPWTVVIKVQNLARLFFYEMGDKMWLHAPEAIAKYGNALDWRTSIGTGPFMTTDFVPGSSVTVVRNPNYWMKDPIGPGKGNQLPYVDKVIALQIPDLSTRVSAMRTGKIDYGIRPLDWEQAESLMKTNPEIPMIAFSPSSGGLSVRQGATDPRAKPLLKKGVRQAMSMAIDREAILRDYYGGQGYIYMLFWWNTSPYYTPLEEMPEIVQKIYSYNPEEARKILAEEGYPNGFKTVLTLSTLDVDYYSMIIGYLKKNLNIDVELDVKEPGVLAAMRTNRTMPAMFTGGGTIAGWTERWMSYGPGDPKAPRNMVNSAEINDPIINDYIVRSEEAWNVGNIELRNKILKEAERYVAEQVYYITLPAANTFNVWQPWLMRVYGHDVIGYMNFFYFATFAWIDQDLKKSLGH